MSVTIKIRRGASSLWIQNDPVLSAGEMGFESDTGKFKIGDGVHAWTSLTYYINETATTVLVQELVDAAVLEGVPGKSAYEVAVDNGFVGTESQWLASLVGPQGPTGATGPKGDTGSQGPQGVKGDTGDTGPQGLIGATGPKGDKGDTGDTGPQGTAGATGPKGDTGDQGPQGTPGTTGADGESAYQIAVDNGFVGTESQWLTSLQGTNGTNGTNGADGTDGESVTVTLVAAADWPPAADSNPLHLYFRVP